MKNVLIAGIVAFASLASAAPIAKRDGPSGQLSTPYGGLSVAQNAGIEIKYSRVNVSSSCSLFFDTV